MPKLTAAGNRTRINFIKAELETALTYCRLAQRADLQHLPGYVRNARTAYDAAVRYMFSLDMGAKEFDQVTAVAERVKYMLEALEDPSSSIPFSDLERSDLQ
jgi:hypothetical protein